MTDFNAYQIALVVVLVLNLVFWILVICFRLFFHFPCGNSDNQQQRRWRVPRRPFQVSRNPSEGSLIGTTNGNFVGDDGVEPFSIDGSLGAPPTYDEAIKHSTIIISQGMSPPSYVNHQQEGSSHGRRPMIYERSVVLMVPEESTSVSETRLTTSLNSTSDGIRRTSVTQTTTAVDLPAANANNGDSSIMQEYDSYNAENGGVVLEDDGPITFTVRDTSSQRVHMTCSTRNVLHIAGGGDLNSHTQA